MYICICNALREKEVAAAASNARNVGDVFKGCGRRPQCGKCLPDIAQIIQEERNTYAEQQAMAAE